MFRNPASGSPPGDSGICRTERRRGNCSRNICISGNDWNIPRLIGKTKTRKHILLFDTMIILGGILGNAVDLYEIPVLMGGKLFLGVFGFSVGVFVGCLVMSLAETLKTVPVIVRRIHLAVGFPYLILSIAAGKLAGALIYFLS